MPTSLRPLCAALALLGTLGACSERGPLSPPTLEPLLVQADGAWFRDAKRRIVLLRGVNYSVLERRRDDGRTRAPREQDFERLAALGVNLIRLPIAWSSIEPMPGVYDPAFLRDKVDPVLRFASNAGMQVVLAMHQARWSDCFPDGNGAPAWTCSATDTTQAQPGLGSADALVVLRAAQAQCAFYRGATAADGRELRAHYADAWRVVARYYEQDKRIAAFDLLDEPSAAACLPDRSFVDELLQAYYANLAREVRNAGAPQALAYQPAVSARGPLLGAPRDLGTQAIFAPHLYSQTFGAPPASDPGARLAASYERALALARALGGPLLIGEIGGDALPQGSYRPVTREFLAASFRELDRLLIGGAVWAFVPNGESPGGDPGRGLGDAELQILARPYARRIGGVPTSMEFDDDTREWRFAFRDDPEVAPPDPTEIFLPAKERYPDGFSVELSDGDRWTFDEHTQRLLVYRGAGAQHTVRVAPPTR